MPDEVTIIGAASEQDLATIVRYLRDPSPGSAEAFHALPNHGAVEYLRSGTPEGEAEAMMKGWPELLYLIDEEAQTYWSRAKAWGPRAE
jgi:hypothetical protein